MQRIKEKATVNVQKIPPSHVELIHREQVVLGTDGAVAADIHLTTIRELVIQ